MLVSENYDDLDAQIKKVQIELDKERAELDRLAAECIRTGRNLSEDKKVMEQNKIVDKLVVKEYRLREMMENAE